MSTCEVFFANHFRIGIDPRKGGFGAFSDTVAYAGEDLRGALDELQHLWSTRTERNLPRSHVSWNAAREFLKSALAGDQFAVPDILPMDDGAILLEWKVPQRYTIQFELRPDGTAELSAFDSSGHEFEMEPAHGMYLGLPYGYAEV